MPPFAQALPAPPQHEWLELVKYWNGGGRARCGSSPIRCGRASPSSRTASPTRYRWPLPYPVLLGGVRPNEMDWYRVDRPEWYVGEGWALTPETAGVADADHRGPGARRRSTAGSTPARRAATLDDRRPQSVDAGAARRASRARSTAAPLVDDALPPGPFLRLIDLPPRAGVGAGDYAQLTVAADAGSRVAIEQFDAVGRAPVVFGFGDGWHEQEYNPRDRPALALAERARRAARARQRPRRRVVAAPRGRVAAHVLRDGVAADRARRRPDRRCDDESLTSTSRSTSTIPSATRGRRATARSRSRPIRSSCRPSAAGASADRRHLGLRIFNVLELDAGFLARQSSELPNGSSNQRSHSALEPAARRSATALTGAGRHGDLLLRVRLSLAQAAPPLQRARRRAAAGTATRSCR